MQEGNFARRGVIEIPPAVVANKLLRRDRPVAWRKKTPDFICVEHDTPHAVSWFVPPKTVQFDDTLRQREDILSRSRSPSEGRLGSADHHAIQYAYVDVGRLGQAVEWLIAEPPYKDAQDG